MHVLSIKHFGAIAPTHTYLYAITNNSAKSKKIKQNLTRPENFDICFCKYFDRYCQKLISGGETRLEIFRKSNDWFLHEMQNWAEMG